MIGLRNKEECIFHANKKVFTSNDDALQLNNETSKICHFVVAKSYFICYHAKSDIKKTVVFF